MRRLCGALMVLAWVAFASSGLSGQASFLEPGFNADKVYSVGDLDAIDLATGSLVVTLPLSETYAVGGTLSYAFRLVYSSNVWDFDELEDDQCWDPDQQTWYTCPHLRAVPARSSNAGMGFRCSLAELVGPGDPRTPIPDSDWVFTAVDGSRHTFLLCAGEAEDCPSHYSTDGQQLRLKRLDASSDSSMVLEYPDGTRYVFCKASSWSTTHAWRLESIRDPFDNRVTVTEGSWGGPDGTWSPQAPVWTISDSAVPSAQRQHRVYFGSHGEVYALDLNISGARKDTVSFEYACPKVHLSYRDTDPSNGEYLNPSSTCAPAGSVPFLTRVVLPDGTAYRMTDDSSSPAYYADANEVTEGPDAPGVLQRLTVPTGGQVAWTMQRWQYSAWGKLQVCQGDPPYTRCIERIDERWSGIGTRTLTDPYTGVSGSWAYTTETGHNLVPTGQGNVPTERRVVVRDPDQNESVRYFQAMPRQYLGSLEGVAEDGTELWTAWSYTLPFTRRQTSILDDPTTAYLSALHYRGAVSFDESGNPAAGYLRSEWVTWGHVPFKASTRDLEYRTASDRFLLAQKTVFDEDEGCAGACWTATEHSGHDYLGHSRLTRTWSNIPGSQERWELTGFNPSAEGGYPAYTLGQDQAGQVRWPLEAAWLLETSDVSWVDRQGGAPDERFTTMTCVERDAGGFPLTGFVRRQRTLFGKDGVPRPMDVVLERTPDTRGNLTRETSHGGDLTQGLPVAGDLCSLALPPEEYRTDHAWSYGVRVASQPIGADGAAFGPRPLDLTVDPRTGRVTTSCDGAGLCTTFEHDAVGRLTWIKPGGGSAYTEIVYTPAGTSAPPSVAVRARGDSSTSGPELLYEEHLYTGFGRSWKHFTKTSASTWVQQVTSHDVMGRVVAVSETESRPAPPAAPPVPAFWTTHSYAAPGTGTDPFGRLYATTPPDGAAHAVTVSHAGVRESTRTAALALAAGETPVSVLERRDGLGAVIAVVEAWDRAEAATTTYSYDPAGHLVSVTQRPNASTTQERTFSFDGRGLLRSESMPEKTAPVEHLLYDSAGHLRCRNDAGTYLRYDLDRAGRPTTTSLATSECGATLTLEERSYHAANLPGSWDRGKVATAARHNHFLGGGDGADLMTVSESYTYGGVGGRASRKQTTITMPPAYTGYPKTLLQSFGWDSLGGLVSETYPDLGYAALGRTATYTRSYGRLTAVPGYASAITYHPSGLVASVAHGNGVSDLVTADPYGQPRPLRLHTDGATLQGAEGDWSSGYFEYDAWGNVKRLAAIRGGTPDPLKTASDSFTYDAMGRLVSASLWHGGWQQQDATYDAVGNLLTLTRNGGDSRSFGVDPATNRISSEAGCTAGVPCWHGAYDAAGDLTSLATDTLQRQSLAYYPDGTMRESTHLGTGRAQIFGYAVDRERVAAYDSHLLGTASAPQAGVLVAIRGLDGKVRREAVESGGTWLWVKDYVYRDGQLLASVSADPDEGTLHAHLDHLGTPRLRTDAWGRQQAKRTYLPYGEEAAVTTPQAFDRLRFTGHERDLADLASLTDDLDYMKARYYSPMIGRFLAVDQGNAQPRQPQTWNQYEYAMGNPLKYIDPDGREALVFVAQPSPDATDPKGAFGHTAIYVTASLSEGPAWVSAGSPVGFERGIDGFVQQYIKQGRAVSMYQLRTTPDQDRRMYDFVRSDPTAGLDSKGSVRAQLDMTENCTTAVVNILKAGGLVAPGASPARSLGTDRPMLLQLSLDTGALANSVSIVVVFRPVPDGRGFKLFDTPLYGPFLRITQTPTGQQ